MAVSFFVDRLFTIGGIVGVQNNATRIPWFNDKRIILSKNYYFAYFVFLCFAFSKRYEPLVISAAFRLVGQVALLWKRKGYVDDRALTSRRFVRIVRSRASLSACCAVLLCSRSWENPNPHPCYHKSWIFINFLFLVGLNVRQLFPHLLSAFTYYTIKNLIFIIVTHDKLALV